MICRLIAYKRIFKTSFECISRGDDYRVAWAFFKQEKVE